MMIQVLWHKLKLWKSLVSGIVPVGLLLVVTYNTAGTPAVQQNLQSNPPPEIIGFTLCPPGSLFPGAIIRIQVDVKSNGHRIDKFHWLVETGEGVIIDGNGDSQITYQAPNTPGIYQIDVELKYEGTKRVRRSTTVEVVPEAVVVAANGLNLRPGPGVAYDPPVDYLSNGEILDVAGRITSNDWIQVVPVSSTNVVSGWVSASSKYVQINVNLDSIPIVEALSTPMSPPASEMPTQPSLPSYPVPVLTGPDNGSGVQGKFPPLFWEWDGKLGEDEFFEVRIWHESIIDSHPALGWVKVPQFDYDVSGELNGKYYWTVIIVKGTNARPKDWTLQPWWPYPMWEGDLVATLSAESEPRFFFFTPDDTSGPGPISGRCHDPLGRPIACR
jgi:hypothetical protein